MRTYFLHKFNDRTSDSFLCWYNSICSVIIGATSMAMYLNRICGTFLYLCLSVFILISCGSLTNTFLDPSISCANFVYLCAPYCRLARWCYLQMLTNVLALPRILQYLVHMSGVSELNEVVFTFLVIRRPFCFVFIVHEALAWKMVNYDSNSHSSL